RFLVITVWIGTDARYQVLYQDLKVADSRPVMLVEGFEHDHSFVGNIGNELYFRTDRDAPLGKLVAIDVSAAAPDNVRQVVPETVDVLTSASLVGSRIIGHYMQDAQSAVKTFDTRGNLLGEIEL